MDFSDHPTASIDFSPTAQARDVTLVLEESELANSSYSRMERFIRVWCAESEAYAPNLKTLTIVLRPSVSAENKIQMLGIQRFLDQCKSIQLPPTIYLDNWSDLNGIVRRKYAHVPSLIRLI